MKTNTRFCQPAEDIHIQALVKGEERYIFVFKDSTRADMLRTLGKFASDPDLSFSWYDAACLSNRVRTGDKECTGK
jgi:hypothetical protein